MAYVDEFAVWVAKAANGEAVTAFDNTNAHIGVGDGTTAEAASQTGLTGVNKVYLPMEAGYPTRSTASTTYRGVADSATGNHDWKEWTIENAAAGAGDCMCRFLQDMGTKAAGIERQITATVNHGVQQ